MSCSIVRNDKGVITDVLTTEGKSSSFFKAVNSNPFLNSPELSARITSVLYLDKYQKMYSKNDINNNDIYEDSKEPKLIYLSNENEMFDDLEDLLIKTDGQIGIGFKNTKGEFERIATIDTNASIKSKFIASQIQEGSISAYLKMGDDGVNRLQGKGEYNETRQASARYFQESLRDEMGIGNVTLNVDGTINVNFPNDLVIVNKKDGTNDIIALKDVSNLDSDNVLNYTELMMQYNSVYVDFLGKKRTSSVNRKENKNLKVLEAKLYSFLRSVGFTTTSLDDYKKRYNTMYGKDPDVEALTDIANKIIAFANGKLDIENLSEEVAHVAISLFADQMSISEALVSVIYTPEYSQYAEIYRAKYSKNYEGVELEDQIRREILGKILAKQFINKFNTENLTQEHSSVILFLKGLWDRIINFWGNKTTQRHIDTINNLVKEVSESVLTENKSTFDESIADTNQDFYYSLASAKAKNIDYQLRLAKESIVTNFKKLNNRVPREKELDDIYEGMTEIETIRAINIISDIVNNQISALEESINNSIKNNSNFTTEDILRYNMLNDNLIPLLENIKVSLNEALKDKSIVDNKNKKIAEDCVILIDNISKKLSYIRPTIDTHIDEYAETLLNEYYDNKVMNDEDRDREKSKIKGGFSDIGFWGKYFGLMTQSENPVIQMMAKWVSNIKSVVNTGFKERINPLIKEIYDKGYQKYQSNIIGRDKNGKRTFYYFSPEDYDALDKYEEEEKIKFVSKLIGQKESKIKSLLKDNSFRDIISDDDKYIEFKEFSKKLREENDEKPMIQEYYDNAEKRFKISNTSQETIETLRNLNQRIFEVTLKAMDSKGRIDKSKLTEYDKINLANIKRDRNLLQNPFNEDGDVKNGLRVVDVSDLTSSDILSLKKDFGIEENTIKSLKGRIVLLDIGVDINSLDYESRTALDMNNLNLLFRQEKSGGRGKPTVDFIQMIRDVIANGENPFDWVMANSTVSLSDEYYESLGEKLGKNKQIENYINSLPDSIEKDDLNDLFTHYMTLIRKHSSLLKQNKSISNPIEIELNGMSLTTMKAISDLDQEIRHVKKELNKLLSEDFEFENTDSIMVREVNDGFNKKQKESGLSIYDFCLEHVSFSDKKKIEKFASQLTNLIKGKSVKMEKGFEIFFNNIVDSGKINVVLDPITNDILNKDEVIDFVISEYAKSNLPSYLIRYVPEGYSEYMDGLSNGSINIEDAINKPTSFVNNNPVSKFIDINPDYSWTEEISGKDLTNPKYKKGGFYRKPKDKWLNDSWFSHYGIKKEDYLALPNDDISLLIPTQNKEEFEFLCMMIKLREEELSRYGVNETINKWQLPQISKSNFEKVFSAENVKSRTGLKNSAKDMFKDIIQNRPDELDYGAQMNGTDIVNLGDSIKMKIIPKYYLDRLESPEAITENILASTIMSYRQSLLYEERSKAESDLNALQIKLNNQNFKKQGGGLKSKITSKGARTNYVQKGEEFLGHQLYGIKQTRSFKTQVMGREVDLTRLVSVIQKTASFGNLGFNLFVDATGATTGIINKSLDSYIGDYYSKSSNKRGNSIYRSFALDYLMETGEVNKNSKMQSALEEFNIVSSEEKVDETKYSRGMRLLGRSPHIMSKASNMLTVPRILFSVLSDYRYYDGKFRSYEEFKILNKEKDILVIKSKWENISKDSLIDNIDFNENGAVLNDNFYKKFSTKEEAEKYYKEIKNDITAKVSVINQKVDGVLSDVDRVAAQRDVVLNTVMMHRGWFLINLSKGFKKKSYNVATGQMEEGHYRTLANFLTSLRDEVFFNKNIEDKKSISDVYLNLNDFEKRNIKRVVVETSLLFLLLLIGEGILSGDDDDDAWIEDFSRLIYLRTVGEFSSSQLYSLPSTVKEIVKSPFVSIKTYEALDPIFHIREGWKSDDDYGIKSVRKLVKGTFLRRYGQYGDIQNQIDSYRFYNDPTLFNLGSIGNKKEDVKTDSDSYFKIK